MIKVHQLPRAFDCLNASPPCLKLETWLRMKGIPHELGPRQKELAPKGKVPFITDVDGTRIGDSNLIIDHLTKRHGPLEGDTHLSPSDRAASLAFRRMLDENFYWVIIETRWKDDAAFAMVENELIAKLAPGAPPELRKKIADGARQSLLAQQHGHGMGRHTREEIMAKGREDLEAVLAWLGDKPFFMGAEPTVADATVFANLVSVLDVAIDSPLRTWALDRPTFRAYLDRIKQRWFADVETSPGE